MYSRSVGIKNLISSAIVRRQLSLTARNFQEESAVVETREVTKDRSQQVPLETSLRYLKSAAYKQTYGNQPVWVPYRRNHKGAIPPRHTRKTCIRNEEISTGNPCPICRDELALCWATAKLGFAEGDNWSWKFALRELMTMDY
ncbi:hypothetical protein HUJ04_002344 [Dendroctonus ponderosae]